MRRSRDADALAAGYIRRWISRFDFDAAAYALAVEAQVNSERLAQAPGTTCEFFEVACAAPLLHQFESSCGLSRAY